MTRTAGTRTAGARATETRTAGARAAGTRTARASRALARVGAAGAVLATGHTLVNLRRLPVPPPAGGSPSAGPSAGPSAAPNAAGSAGGSPTALPPGDPTSRVSPPGAGVVVCVPLRDEQDQVAALLGSLRAALDGLPGARALLLDDQSRDATCAALLAGAAADPRLAVLAGAPLPAGWLGKPHACAQLAAAALRCGAQVLVFTDADVRLAPDGLARTVAGLRASAVDLYSPYPRQLCRTPAERLVQPLLQWSWLTFLPLRAAQRSARPSLAAANGQLLAVTAQAYRAAGGHAAVAGDVVDDIALLRAVKRAGYRGTVADGTTVADCRMYTGWAALRDGYTKSLGAAFGGAAGTAATTAGLGLLYLAPPAGWLRWRRDPLLAVGALAGLAGRAVVARRVGGRVWPDSAAHPVSVLLLAALGARSVRARARGSAQWKGRPVTDRAAAPGTAPGAPGDPRWLTPAWPAAAGAR